MNNKCLFILLSCILLLGCSEKKESVEVINGNQFIKVLRKEAICLNDIDSYGHKLLQKFPMKPLGGKYSAVYAVDGSCSVCIAKLLKIIELMSTYHCDCKINIMTEKSFKSSVEYYVKKYFKGIDYNIISVDDGIISNNDYNGTLMIVHNGEIVESAIFVDMKDSDK